MKKLLRFGFLISILPILFINTIYIPTAKAQGQTSSAILDEKDISITDLYFLSIGSKDHVPNTPGYLTLEKGAAPVRSATRVAETLLDQGARHGILLVSDDNRVIAKEDMRHALTALKKRIRQDAPRNPLIFVYIMAHGLGDQASHYLYLLPGNLLIKENSHSQTMTIKLIKSALWSIDVAGSLVMFRMHPSMTHWDEIFLSDLMPDITSLTDTMKSLQQSQRLIKKDEYNRKNHLYPEGKIPPIPFVVMIDNCYGGITQNLVNMAKQSNNPLYQTFNELFTSMLGFNLNQLAEYENEGLVLYATDPGQKVSDFPDPKNSFFNIGSLARRFILALSTFNQRGQKEITVGDLRDMLANPDIDRDQQVPESDEVIKPTSPPYYISDTKPDILEVTLFTAINPNTPSNKIGTLDKRYGTATEPVYCRGPK